MDGSRIRNKTVSFSFENGVVWTGPKALSTLCRINLKTQLRERKRNKCSASTPESFRWLFTFKISKYHILRYVDYLGR